MRPDVTEIRTLFAEAGLAADVEAEGLGVVARVAHSEVLDALAAFKASGYESLLDFDGTDTGEAIDLMWRLRSYSKGEEAYLKTTVAYDGRIDSAWNLYPGALMPERETAELFGLSLAGHPNPKRLLTTDGVPPLLRKSVAIRTEEEARER